MEAGFLTVTEPLNVALLKPRLFPIAFAAMVLVALALPATKLTRTVQVPADPITPPASVKAVSPAANAPDPLGDESVPLAAPAPVQTTEPAGVGAIVRPVSVSVRLVRGRFTVALLLVRTIVKVVVSPA